MRLYFFSNQTGWVPQVYKFQPDAFKGDSSNISKNNANQFVKEDKRVISGGESKSEVPKQTLGDSVVGGKDVSVVNQEKIDRKVDCDMKVDDSALSESMNYLYSDGNG